MDEPKYEAVKFIDDELELEVNVDPSEETIWMTQEQIVILFNSTKQNVSLHINNIIRDGELDYSTVKEILTVRQEGNRRVNRKIKYFNLDMIISVGYRVNSKKGIEFRKWANKVLKDYLLKGYVINEKRVIVSNENYIELRNEVANINNRLEKVEDKVHDRYIVIDKVKLYHLGASIKDLGRKIFSISESDSSLIKGLLNNI